ncbi:MAG: translation initiation factor IF-2 [Planctomycetota bacterium]|nr:MAG: translation initiation factor IF-2 [Planctomycetota bacterium]
MKLIELALEHNLDQELLREVVEEDLKITLSEGMETALDADAVRRILACDGLETVDGEEFAPIIDEKYLERHKRSQAAKKAAETRRRKDVEAKRKAEEEREAQLAEERRKHEEALAKRREDEERKAREAEEEAQRAAQEEAARESAEETARRAAEDELRRREQEAARLSEELAALRAQEAALAQQNNEEATDLASDKASSDTPDTADEIVAAPTEDPETPSQDHPVETETSEATTEPAAETTSVEATPEPASESEEDVDADPSAIKKGKIGSKLASLAKATAEKSDHRLKEKDERDLRVIESPRVGSISGTDGQDSELSAEERRKMIQDNIRRNMDMQNRVRQAKQADRKRRFKPIDRSKTGAAGPGAGPAGGPAGPAGPGGPGRSTGPRRDRKDHRADKPEEREVRRGGRRRPLSTEEEDLSGKKEFTVTLPCTVRDFSEASGLKSSTVIGKLLMAGVVANINSVMERDAIELIAMEFEKEVTVKEEEDVEDTLISTHEEDDKPEDLAPRPPVVTILGHVDHGKTSLLDAIRHTEITAGEAGGITQHIGAYTVTAPTGQDITFVDTPGHAAFTEMRARGANVTDLAVVVVAADDGLMPQSIEAINHAKAAQVPIIVAMNKIDRESADPDKVLRQLAEQGLLPEEWGGDTGVIRTSAITRQGLEELLERISLESEVLELQSNHFANASGTVLEAHISEGRGVVATLLVRRGSLAIGDIVLAGTGYGRVRSMSNWKGEQPQIAGPSHAVETIGLSEMPTAGDRFHTVDSLKVASEIAETRSHQIRDRELRAKNTTTTLASLFSDLEEAQKKEVRLIVKADASGSLEVLRKTLNDLSTEEVKVNFIHSGVGQVTSTDVSLAEASGAIILGFHVIADSRARREADSKGIDVKTYTVIYELIDEVKLAMTGLLDPDMVEKIIGHAEVLKVFRSSKAGTIAGCLVRDGIVMRGAFMRLTRDGVVLYEGKVDTLRRFTEDVKEVREGFECGLTLDRWNDIQEGDLFEFHTKKAVARTLESAS